MKQHRPCKGAGAIVGNKRNRSRMRNVTTGWTKLTFYATISSRSWCEWWGLITQQTRSQKPLKLHQRWWRYRYKIKEAGTCSLLNNDRICGERGRAWWNLCMSITTVSGNKDKYPSHKKRNKNLLDLGVFHYTELDYKYNLKEVTWKINAFYTKKKKQKSKFLVLFCFWQSEYYMYVCWFVFISFLHQESVLLHLHQAVCSITSHSDW